MFRPRTLIVVGLLVWATTAMLTAQARRTSSQSYAPLMLTGSIKEIMDGIVDPTADVLFDAVTYDVTAAGVEEKMPKTREEWADVRRHALLLVEATNLLKMRGRRVAPKTPVLELEPTEKGPEDLGPDEIQALIDADPAAFSRLAQGLADAALTALQAADAMSVDKLFESGDAIDKACENCHLRYWYPKDHKPATDALSRRKR
jgi:hypothetical protein